MTYFLQASIMMKWRIIKESYDETGERECFAVNT